MKTAEEILKRYWIFAVDTPDTLKRCVIEAMQEYAHQFREPIVVTNEEIEAEAQKQEILLSYHKFKEGALWTRAMMTKTVLTDVDLREIDKSICK